MVRPVEVDCVEVTGASARLEGAAGDADGDGEWDRCN